MGKIRDNFSKLTTEVLAKRVGYICSNPNCRKPTIGPNMEINKATSIGIAAHIEAASPGGPRYNESMSAQDRVHINNGIWLCSNCATLIDKDSESFSVEALKTWRKVIEEETSRKLNGEHLLQIGGDPFLEIDLVKHSCGRYFRSYSEKNPIIEINGRMVRNVGDKPIIHWEIIWRYSFFIFNNSNFAAYNINLENIGPVCFTFLTKIPRINNLPPFEHLELEAKYIDFIEGNADDATVIMKDAIPIKLEGLELKIAYFDDMRREHSTFVSILNGELRSTKK